MSKILVLTASLMPIPLSLTRMFTRSFFFLISILIKELAVASGDKVVRELWKAFEEHLKVFTAEHDFDETKITADVNKGKAMIDDLSEKLSNNK